MPLLAWRLRKVCNEFSPDILHIITEPYALIVPFLGRWKKRVVLTIHGSYGIRPLEQWRTARLARAYYRMIPRFVTISRYTQQAVSEKLGGIDRALKSRFDARVSVVKNGTAIPDHWMSERSETVKNILLVGALKPRKGVLQAVRACALYKKTFGKPFVFSIVGKADEDDSYVREVRALIAAEHLENDIRLLGRVEDAQLNALYDEADVFLMPAATSPDTFEGFGLVYIEANARGIPCIGPDDSGAAEAIDEGVTGFKAHPDDTQALCQALHAILDEGVIKRENCRTWAEKHSIESMARAMEIAYADVRADRSQSS